MTTEATADTDPPATRGEVVYAATQLADEHHPDGVDYRGHPTCDCGWAAADDTERWADHLVQVLGVAGVLADPAPPRPPRPTVPVVIPAVPEPDETPLGEAAYLIEGDDEIFTPVSPEVVAGD